MPAGAAGRSFYLIGWSFGGTLAHAVAATLEGLGHEVAFLALLDCEPAEPEAMLVHAGKKKAVYRGELEEAFGQYMNYPNMAGSSTAWRRWAPTSRIMAEYESPVYGGDLLYFDAALTKGRTGRCRTCGGLCVLGPSRPNDVNGTHLDCTMPARSPRYSRVVNRKSSSHHDDPGCRRPAPAMVPAPARRPVPDYNFRSRCGWRRPGRRVRSPGRARRRDAAESLRTLIVENADGTPEQRVAPMDEAHLCSGWQTSRRTRWTRPCANACGTVRAGHRIPMRPGPAGQPAEHFLVRVPPHCG